MTDYEALERAVAQSLRYGREARLLTMSCPNDHALLRVYATALGPVAVWDEHAVEGVPTTNGVRTRRVAGAATRYCLLDEGPGPAPVPVCRCRRVTIAFDQVRQAVDSGRRRVRVANGGEPL